MSSIKHNNKEKRKAWLASGLAFYVFFFPQQKATFHFMKLEFKQANWENEVSMQVARYLNYW